MELSDGAKECLVIFLSIAALVFAVGAGFAMNTVVNKGTASECASMCTKTRALSFEQGVCRCAP